MAHQQVLAHQQVPLLIPQLVLFQQVFREVPQQQLRLQQKKLQQQKHLR